MVSIKRLVPLLVAAGILLGGNGLQGTLIAIKGGEAGFSTPVIGFMGAAYFMGFMLGCMFISRLLISVGHIRVFSAMAAIAAAGSLLLIVVVDPVMWTILRFLMGICFSSLFATVESWINSEVENKDRARLLSIYRLIDLTCVTASQYLIPGIGTDGFEIFVIMGILITLSLVPISLADRSNPKPPRQIRFSLKGVWAISPIACIGCIAIGLTGAAFRIIGPVYAQSIGMSVASIATFMSAGIVGGAVLQYPLGMMSDRLDRRITLIVATAGAMLSGLFISWFAGTDPMLNYIGIFMFGAFALPLYSLSAAHANDHATDGDFVQVAAGLMFFWSIGAILGPFAASLLMQAYGPQSLFAFTSVVHGLLILITFYRMYVRAAIPMEERGGRFQTLLRTSPMMAKLTRRKR